MLKSFWLKKTNLLTWQKLPKKAYLKNDDNKYLWFPDGKMNIYENCILKYIENGLKNKIAIHTISKKRIIKNYTYIQLDKLIDNFIQNLLKKNKNKKLKRIMIHSSANINSAVSMLALSKLGIFFSVIFEDLPLEAIKKRIDLFKPNLIISNTLSNKDCMKSKVLSFDQLQIKNKKIVKKKLNYFKADRDFFTLFTSGSTGMPKGIVHSMGGYLLYTKFTCIEQFGMNDSSIVLTASDAGWINGHTYALFGPLSLGATTVLLESPMLVIDELFLIKLLKLQINILYLPVTIIRIMKKLFSKKKITNHKLQTLGSMGEPLAPSVGSWITKKMKMNKNSIVNTYFQTETAGIISSPKYSEDCKSRPHGSVGDTTNKIIKLNIKSNKKPQEIKILTPWPGLMKRVINGENEWKKYWDNNQKFRMFDLGQIRKKNLYIHGRVDDVINIRGHRIGSAEVESVILSNKNVSECCAISIFDELEGNKFFIFVVSKKNNIEIDINKIIQSNFGSFALPKKIYKVKELPKTRSGKYLRRLLRILAENPNTRNLGDISTINNIKSLDNLKNAIKSS